MLIVEQAGSFLGVFSLSAAPPMSPSVRPLTINKYPAARAGTLKERKTMKDYTEDFIPSNFAVAGAARLVGAYETTDCPHCQARNQTASLSCRRCDTYIRSSQG